MNWLERDIESEFQTSFSHAGLSEENYSCGFRSDVSYPG